MGEGRPLRNKAQSSKGDTTGSPQGSTHGREVRESTHPGRWDPQKQRCFHVRRGAKGAGGD